MADLRGVDYLVNPISKLIIDPDFSNEAMRVMIAISRMTTEQIETISLPGEVSVVKDDNNINVIYD